MIKEIYSHSNYFCCDGGHIYTRNWKNTGLTRRMKPAVDKKGYLRTVLVSDAGKHKTVKVHRVICESWHENPEDKPQVNHKNGNKQDNSPMNLEWNTAKENVGHAIKNGLFVYSTPKKAINKIIKRGELNGCAKLTEKQVLEIRNKFKPRIYTRKKLGLEFNVSEATIKDIILRKSWTHI